MDNFEISNYENKRNISLLDSPFNFQNGFFSGSFFSLPLQSYNGGDYFKIRSNGKKAAIVFADATGHGNHGKSSLLKYKKKLDSLLDLSKEKDELEKILFSIDKSILPFQPIALSVAFLKKEGILNYRNFGENFFRVSGKNGVKTHERDNHGFLKLGTLHLSRDRPPKKLLKTIDLESGDKIYFATDGIYELENDEEIRGYTITGKLLSSTYNLSRGIKGANREFFNYTGYQGLDDDYTILSIEIN